MGSLNMDEITDVHIEVFADWLAIKGNTRVGSGCSNETVNRYFSTISLFMKKAAKLQYTSSYSAFAWKTESKGRRRYFSNTEQDQLFEFFRTDNHYSQYPWLAVFLRLGSKKD